MQPFVVLAQVPRTPQRYDGIAMDAATEAIATRGLDIQRRAMLQNIVEHVAKVGEEEGNSVLAGREIQIVNLKVHTAVAELDSRNVDATIVCVQLRDQGPQLSVDLQTEDRVFYTLLRFEVKSGDDAVSTAD